jgi:ATP-binding cassette subfamily C (CFTR/MRP) protein 4
MILINLVFKKMTQLNAYSIKEANVGKIINLISGDLSLLEYHFVVVFQILILPVILIFGSAILWVFEISINLGPIRWTFRFTCHRNTDCSLSYTTDLPINSKQIHYGS